MRHKIQTYIINLEKREERKAHIFQQFENKLEFQIHLVRAIENEIGALGLWYTILQILKNAETRDSSYILICEDDHQFTDDYNQETLLKAIQEAQQKNADILMGGVSWFNDAVQVSSNLFWVDEFTGAQFIVIYRKFFGEILNAEFGSMDVADIKIASLATDKFIIYPFISIQKEFGYSDVTIKNNVNGYVEQIFNDASEKLSHLVKVSSFYKLKF